MLSVRRCSIDLPPGIGVGEKFFPSRVEYTLRVGLEDFDWRARLGEEMWPIEPFNLAPTGPVTWGDDREQIGYFGPESAGCSELESRVVPTSVIWIPDSEKTTCFP